LLTLVNALWTNIWTTVFLFEQRLINSVTNGLFIVSSCKVLPKLNWKNKCLKKCRASFQCQFAIYLWIPIVELSIIEPTVWSEAHMKGFLLLIVKLSYSEVTQKRWLSRTAHWRVAELGLLCSRRFCVFGQCVRLCPTAPSSEPLLTAVASAQSLVISYCRREEHMTSLYVF